MSNYAFCTLVYGEKYTELSKTLIDQITSDIKLKPHDRVFLGDDQSLNWTEPVLGVRYEELTNKHENAPTKSYFNWIVLLILFILLVSTGLYILNLPIFN